MQSVRFHTAIPCHTWCPQICSAVRFIRGAEWVSDGGLALAIDSGCGGFSEEARARLSDFITDDTELYGLVDDNEDEEARDAETNRQRDYGYRACSKGEVVVVDRLVLQKQTHNCH